MAPAGWDSLPVRLSRRQSDLPVPLSELAPKLRECRPHCQSCDFKVECAGRGRMLPAKLDWHVARMVPVPVTVRLSDRPRDCHRAAQPASD
jgi:hypothetical protein